MKEERQGEKTCRGGEEEAGLRRWEKEEKWSG